MFSTKRKIQTEKPFSLCFMCNLQTEKNQATPPLSLPLSLSPSPSLPPPSPSSPLLPLPTTTHTFSLHLQVGCSKSKADQMSYFRVRGMDLFGSRAFSRATFPGRPYSGGGSFPRRHHGPCHLGAPSSDGGLLPSEVYATPRHATPHHNTDGFKNIKLIKSEGSGSEQR